MHSSAVVFRVRSSDRIAGNGHHRDVARIDKTSRQHCQRRLTTDAVIDFRRRVQRHAKATLHETRGGLFVFRNAIVRVAAILRLVDFCGQLISNAFGGHRIVLADAEIDQTAIGIVGECLSLGTLDLLELVDLRTFSVLCAADTISE